MIDREGDQDFVVTLVFTDVAGQHLLTQDGNFVALRDVNLETPDHAPDKPHDDAARCVRCERYWISTLRLRFNVQIASTVGSARRKSTALAQQDCHVLPVPIKVIVAALTGYRKFW